MDEASGLVTTGIIPLVSGLYDKLELTRKIHPGGTAGAIFVARALSSRGWEQARWLEGQGLGRARPTRS